MKTMIEVARECGVGYNAIYRLHYQGIIPEPEKIGGKRWYSETDIQRIKDYFEMRRRIAEIQAGKLPQ